MSIDKFTEKPAVRFADLGPNGPMYMPREVLRGSKIGIRAGNCRLKMPNETNGRDLSEISIIELGGTPAKGLIEMYSGRTLVAEIHFPSYDIAQQFLHAMASLADSAQTAPEIPKGEN